MLKIANFSLEFPDTGFKAIDNISFEIEQGEILALVGESGSGKTLTALSTMGLEPSNSQSQGAIFFKDQDLRQGNYPVDLRGKDIALIPQDPLSSLNPMYSIYDQLAEAVLVHNKGFSKNALKEKLTEDLVKVGIPDPARVLKAYPHEISGGMRQRVMIAMAMVNDPDLLIADEPTTALDVTVQALILELLKSLGKTILFITHDLAVVAEIADRVVVMKQGQILEQASVYDIFEKPCSDYTKELIALMPSL